MTDNKTSDNKASGNKASSELLELQLKQIEVWEEAQAMRLGLPHLYGHSFYPWQRKLLNSQAKILCCTAANQCGKSSSAIAKVIDWATRPELWPELWPRYCKPIYEGGKAEIPSQFWYLYPTADVATIEFEEKWRKLLPQGEYKSHPTYGWRETYDKGNIFSITFNSGVTIYFKSYGQGATNLQAASVFFMILDEETPEELFSELSFRVSATDGYMMFVFTATLGQAFWKEVVEEKTKLPEAEVIQVSLYDCQVYEDGTASQWTNERIKQAINRCKSQAEIDRRIFGRFVVDEGLKYQTFDKNRNTSPWHPLPKTWFTFVGVDYGGGGTSHPSAITFVGVSPEYDKARIYKFWRGDGIGNTTAEDVIKQYLKMIKGINPTAIYFDWACKDMGEISNRMGMSFQRAEKSHDIGETTLNTLFKSGALKIYMKSAECPYPEDLQTEKLIQEFSSLLEKTNKNSARDDGIDSARYGVSKVPWDWELIANIKEVAYQSPELTEIDYRRGAFDDEPEVNELLLEMSEWEDLHDY